MMVKRFGSFAAAILLVAVSAGSALAAAPSNDKVSGARALTLDVPVEFNSSQATTSPSDPTDCNGSHGSWPGPYFASVWFSYTATKKGQLHLSAPTMQGTAEDFLAISFIYLKTATGLTLIDCTAFGNDASWPATKGQTFLIMEAGLSSAVTEEPAFSDKGGHGTIAILRTSNAKQYAFVDFFTYDDCGFTVNGSVEGRGKVRLKPGKHGDPTPYYFERYEWHVVQTNPANGKWFREDGKGVYRDVKITLVEGTIYQFVAKETGRPYKLTDMNGNVIFADHGVLVTTFQVDTKGDSDLSNDEFIEGSFQLLKERGDHPFWFFEGDFCEIVQDLIG